MGREGEGVMVAGASGRAREGFEGRGGGNVDLLIHVYSERV